MGGEKGARAPHALPKGKEGIGGLGELVGKRRALAGVGGSGAQGDLGGSTMRNRSKNGKKNGN